MENTLDNYKVVICGAHSQGKTTLVNKLQASQVLSSDLNFSYKTNTTRDLSKLLPINERGNSSSQYLIMARHLEFALTKGRWIIDRGALDGIAYSHYFYDKGTVDKDIMDAIKHVYMTCVPYYNKVFYIVPELPLVNDGTRSLDQDFFDGVVKQFDFYINHHIISDKVILLTGSATERYQRVIAEIAKDFEDEL